MADVKQEPKPFFTTEKVTLWAPKKPKHHKPFEKVQVQLRQKDKFLSQGYTETEPVEAQPPAKTAGADGGAGPQTMTTK